MKNETIDSKLLAKLIVDKFYDRIHFPNQNQISKYIDTDECEFTGRKGFYGIELDNVSDWGYQNAFGLWKSLEKELSSEYNIEVLHNTEKKKTYWYTYYGDKIIYLNNKKTIICLNTRMMQPRYPKEVSNEVYIEMNDKTLFYDICLEVQKRNNTIKEQENTVSIGEIFKCSSTDIGDACKDKHKVAINTIAAIIDKHKDKDFNEFLEPILAKVLGEVVKNNHLMPLEKNIYNAAYIQCKVGVNTLLEYTI